MGPIQKLSEKLVSGMLNDPMLRKCHLFKMLMHFVADIYLN